MNLTSDASSLSKHGCKLCSHPAEPELKYQPRKDGQDEQEERVKPVCLIEKWFQVKTEGGAGLIPDAVIVAGDYFESVCPRPQVGVVGDASCTAIYPVLVKTLQLILKPDLLRRDEARGSVVQIKARCARRQLNAISRCQGLIINTYFLNHHWRRLRIYFYSLWVDHRDALDGWKPKPSISTFPSSRIAASATFSRHHALSGPVRNRGDRRSLHGRRFTELCFVVVKDPFEIGRASCRASVDICG